LILEEAPGSDARDATAAFGLRPMHTPELVTLAAPSRDGLLAAIRALQARLAETPHDDLRAIAAQTAAQPAHGDQRLAIVAADRDDLAKKLTASAKRLTDAGLHQFQTRNGIQFNDEPVGGKVAFLFPGENSQYPGMLKDLALLSPAVRHWFDRLDDLFLGERDVPHRTMIFPPPTCVTPEQEAALEGRLRRVDFGSESVFFADQALLTLLRLFGVKPDFMVGHSTGENSALIASGIVVMSRDEVCDYVHRMNEIFKRLEDSDVIPSGTLLTIGAAERSDIEQALASEPSLLFTMDNCPNQAILCGPKEAVDRAAARLTERGAICSTLPMSWAYHTPFVAPMADAFKDLFSGSKYGEPEARLYSCASAGPFPSEPEKILRLACDQYVSPVRFADTIERLYEDGARVFIEVGPQSNLTGFVRDILRKRAHLAVSLNSDRRPAFEQFLLSLAQLFVHQVPFDAGKLYTGMPAAPAKPTASAPALKSELPYVRLSPQNVERMREILGVSGGAAPAMAHPAEAAAMPSAVAVPQTAPTAQPAALQSTQPAALQSTQPAASQSAPAAPRAIAAPLQPARAPSRQGTAPAALSRHLSLMDEMLGSSESVTRTALRRRQSGRQPLKTWSGNLPLPHPAALEFASLAPWVGRPEDGGALSTLARSVLPAGDLAPFEQDIARTSPRRQRDWLAGRIAARNALLTWCGRHGENGAAMEIAYDGEGRPIARGPNGANGVYLSISHKDGLAVAAAANRAVGIDLERLAPLRNTEGFLQVAFTESEIEVLRADLAVRPDVTAVTAWSAKEAAAKACGQKLLGREQTFKIVAFDSASRQIRLTWTAQSLDVTYYVDGRFVCCFAAVS
jgi:acyl transferase domain-containing protein